MKTIRELDIKDWSGYFFEEMVNILQRYIIFVILIKLVNHTLLLII